MKKERTTKKVAELVTNDGQLGWLPANPRTWTRNDIDRTSRSIAKDTDFLEDRPILAVPNGGKFVVFAGNLRYTASKGLALKSVPVVVYTPETDEDKETIKRRAVLDNGQYGAWDYDALANEWDDLPLVEFGVPTWNPAPVPTGNYYGGESADTAPEGQAPEGTSALPEELQGLDIAPSQLEKIEGDDKTAMERIIICYKAEDAQALSELLALDTTIAKVLYRFDNGRLV